MKFRFAARVIAQLGAELISSDDIAVYELIKNAFDAGSPRVRLAIRYLASVQDLAAIQAGIKERFAEESEDEDEDVDEEERLEAVRDYVRDAVGSLQPIATQLGPALRAEKARVVETLAAADEDRLIKIVGTLNSITISDTGSGMNEGKLEQCFLTIGTTHRLREHEALPPDGDDDEEPTVERPAGEKGIGRLSAMRLGNDLQVRTWTASEPHVHVLTIDWRAFGPDAVLEAQQIEMELRQEPKGSEDPPSGTVLTITDLQSPWDEDKVKEVAARFLSRFLNPFASNTRIVDIVWNDQTIEIPILSRRYLDASHNGMLGRVTIDRDKRFTLKIDYWFRDTETGERRTRTRTYSSADFGGLRDADIVEVGPFTFELYHYNRARITAIQGYATRKQFKDWLDEWAGGLMLYRDGLRVMPYGRMPDDDWLELDRHALRRSGFRVNRIQVVGCVKISRSRNPFLVDQTNREGLRDNAAARTYRKFLQRIIQELFVKLLDQEVRPAGKTDEELIDRSADLQASVDEAVELLTSAAEHTDAAGIEQAAQSLRTALADVPRITADLQEAVRVHTLQRLEILELAATGMTAMSLAHDLEAALDTALAEGGALAAAPGIRGDLKNSLEHLVALFKSLRTLVADIKPGPAKTRRRKSTFDVVAQAEQLKTFYQPTLDRANIQVEMKVQPPRKPFRVKAVEGHVRQVLDNLYRNAIYWLADTQEKYPHDAEPSRIRLLFDLRSRTLTFSDTGVGVAQHDSEWIFEPFTTHREGGFGLGLYISRELCKFNGIGIRIDPDSINKWRRHDKFVLDFSECFVEGDS